MTQQQLPRRRHAKEFVGPPLNRSSVFLWERIRLGCKVCRECGEPWHWAVVERPGISPQINIVGQIMAIRRAVYILKHGKPPPRGTRATSDCPNRHCCDPDQVIARKVSHMVKDTYARGARDNIANAAHLARYNEARGKKLGTADVQAIRASTLTPAEEARRRGLSADYVSNIRNGQARMASDLGMFSALIKRHRPGRRAAA